MINTTWNWALWKEERKSVKIEQKNWKQYLNFLFSSLIFKLNFYNSTNYVYADIIFI